MNKVSTSDRLKEIMALRNLRQVDILEKAKPYCQEYNVKMNKSDLSQYVSGLVEPGQEKLTILGMALDVSEAWLMGFDVPMDRKSRDLKEHPQFSQSELSLLHKYKALDAKGKHTVKTVLDMEYNRCTNFVIAAHNEDTSEEELELMKQDIDEL